jgi:type III secretion protein J
MKRSGVRTLALAAAMLVLTGCAKISLYSQLSEQQANEIIALLLGAQIDADKELAEDKTWIVNVSKSNLPRAVDLLRGYGYPHEQYQSFGEVFKKDSFVSSPLEERARFLFALSQELSRTVSQIDGVIIARVHVAVPERDPLSDQVRPSSASVFIKHRTDAQMQNHVAAIKALVVNSIEGLPYDNVTVTLFAADPFPFAAEKAARTATMGFGLVGNPWFVPSMTASGIILLIGALFSAWNRKGGLREFAAAWRNRSPQQAGAAGAGTNSGAGYGDRGNARDGGLAAMLGGSNTSSPGSGGASGGPSGPGGAPSRDDTIIRGDPRNRS